MNLMHVVQTHIMLYVTMNSMTNVTSFSETLKNAAIGANKGRNKHKDKPWHDIDCKSKLRHIKSLGRLLGNSPWDKSLRLKSCMRKNSIINLCAKNIGYLNPNYYRILLNRLIITPEFWIIVNL